MRFMTWVSMLFFGFVMAGVVVRLAFGLYERSLDESDVVIVAVGFLAFWLFKRDLAQIRAKDRNR